MTIHFTEFGSQFRGGGQPHYLLVHGLGGARQQWREVQRRLGEDRYSIAIDVPGFGESRDDGPFEIHHAADEIAEFCRLREINDYVLVSHSIGSTVSGLLAAIAAARFRRVVLVSGTLFRASAIAQRPVRALRSLALGLAVGTQFLTGSVPVSPRMRRLLADSPTMRQLALWPFVAHARKIDPQLLSAGLEGSGSAAVLRILIDAKQIDYNTIMAGVPQPVDLVWGRQDRLIDHNDIRLAKRLMHIERTQEIHDCAHWPMIECPEFLASLLRTWGENERNHAGA